MIKKSKISSEIKITEFSVIFKSQLQKIKILEMRHCTETCLCTKSSYMNDEFKDKSQYNVSFLEFLIFL